MPVALTKDTVVGGTVVAFALLELFFLVPYGVDDPGTVDVMALGPNFWPTVIGVFLLFMGSLVIGQDVLRRRTRAFVPEPPDSPDSPATVATVDGEENGPALLAPVPRTIAAVALLFVYYAVLDPLGMVAASMLAMAAFTLLAGERRLTIVIPLALAVPVVLFLFFREIAQVSIPLGLFEDWIE